MSKCAKANYYKGLVAIPMGTNCAPLVADLFCIPLQDSTLNTTPVDFYPSINAMWINLLVFQTPDGNRVAKEIGLEYGFI